MDIKPIKTEDDYNQALKRLEAIFHAPIDSKEGDEAEVLSILFGKYEEEKYPIDAPDPIEAILFRMEQMEMTKRIWQMFWDIKVGSQRFLVKNEN